MGGGRVGNSCPRLPLGKPGTFCRGVAVGGERGIRGMSISLSQSDPSSASVHNAYGQHIWEMA